ncbi:MAG: hypothetical protein B7Z38_00120 [Rhodobacterales bacterium 12-64-8]|nr:MAG: hypothetical protein B7Z38_00120 [Rhodobacterales bacterium 12-64-8]
MMQQTRRKLEGPGYKTRMSDLRAQFQAASNQVGKPPKPRKAVQRESDEERAVKAERQALAQHTTSLLPGGNAKKPYKRPGEREGRKGGLFVQLVLVMAVAGGVALVLDPSIVPAEWVEQARSLIGKYVKI